jgi:hypothetical protein
MLAMRSQRIGDTRATRFFIEAPSTCNEMLLGRHILAGSADPRMRRWVGVQFLGTFLHNFVTHLLQGHLEHRLYALAEAGEPLTLAAIAGAQREVYARFYGDTVAVDEGMSLDWMTVPHYYTGLYPFTYAAGLACGHAVAEAIGREGTPAAERWVATLKAGGTRPPLELMRMAGVDMTTAAPLRRAVAYFGELVGEGASGLVTGRGDILFGEDLRILGVPGVIQKAVGHQVAVLDADIAEGHHGGAGGGLSPQPQVDLRGRAGGRLWGQALGDHCEDAGVGQIGEEHLVKGLLVYEGGGVARDGFEVGRGQTNLRVVIAGGEMNPILRAQRAGPR